MNTEYFLHNKEWGRGSYSIISIFPHNNEYSPKTINWKENIGQISDEHYLFSNKSNFTAKSSHPIIFLLLLQIIFVFHQDFIAI